MKRLLVLPLLCAAPFLAQAADYTTDADHTFVHFEVLHNGTSTVRGRFDTVEGRVAFDREARTGRADIRIDVGSINTGSKGFDEHLRGGDFFLAERHPDARFESTAFHFKGDLVRAVEGNLTLLGQTHPVTLNAVRFNCYQNKRLGREVCGGDFRAEIKRSQWGMGFGLPGIPDAVRLDIEIEGVRQ
ncbi:YceI family protein [Castellaniella ginsengisoli]|jgi:polyisoprenoid-binding protein YceI|uniref:YceI family protein n=1 Tax=Castellaniella ginsengisoli TaxID=546114 RepID=A0AB39EAU4_9BURK